MQDGEPTRPSSQIDLTILAENGWAGSVGGIPWRCRVAPLWLGDPSARARRRRAHQPTRQDRHDRQNEPHPNPGRMESTPGIRLGGGSRKSERFRDHGIHALAKLRAPRPGPSTRVSGLTASVVNYALVCVLVSVCNPMGCGPDAQSGSSPQARNLVPRHSPVGDLQARDGHGPARPAGSAVGPDGQQAISLFRTATRSFGAIGCAGVSGRRARLLPGPGAVDPAPERAPGERTARNS